MSASPSPPAAAAVADGEKPQTPSYSQFACIGTGFSAVALGATLQRWHGITDVRFFERHDELGGTWFVNQYPGCACDVPSVLYSFSFAPNPKWDRMLSSSQQLHEYLVAVANDHDLPSKMTFGAQVVRCEWRADTTRWRLTVRLNNGRHFLHESQFLFGATGLLVTPRAPDLPGLDSFAGTVFHAARWPPGLSLAGKDVALVGNGCTAAQIVPSIVAETRHLTQYMRSKHWIIPPLAIPHRTINRLLPYVPGLLALMRFCVFLVAENDWRGFYMTRAGERFRKDRERSAIRYIRDTAPAKFHDKLTPDLPIGCKRRIYDPGYCRALHAPNFDLLDDPIAEVVPDGIRTRDGTLTKADVIILANGYATNEFMTGIDMVGRGGVTLAQHWQAYDGPEAYNCVALSDFPNFFMILGPNTATGHTSTVMAMENAINYALRIIKPVLDGDADTAEVKPEAEAAYSRQMQSDLRKTVWWGGCSSWYKTAGRSGRMWNSMTYPHSQAHYWYRCLFPVYDDWKYTMRPGAMRRRFLRKALKLALWTALLAWGVGAGLSLRRKGLDAERLLPRAVLEAYRAARARAPF